MNEAKNYTIEDAGAAIEQAIAYQRSGCLEKAEEIYDSLLQLNPDHPELLHMLAIVSHQQKNHDQSARLLTKAIAINPNNPEYYSCLGDVFKDQRRLKDALVCYHKALQLRPEFAEACFNLAETLKSMGKNEDAIENYRQALRCRPDMAEAHNNLGNLLKDLGYLDMAINHYEAVIRLEPNLAEPYYNMGSALRRMDKFQEAAAYLKHALQLKPDYAEACNNLGLAYKNQGHLGRAIERFTRAVEINPQLVEARWNRSFAHLLLGNFKDGWKDYECRLQQAGWKSLYPFRFQKPRWNGRPCPDKTIFVHDEQGLGDTLQFVRYLPMLKRRCAKVIFETRRSLIGILERHPGIDQLVPRLQAAPAAENWDFFIPLLSLPAIFGTSLDTIPKTMPYIQAPTEKAAYWRQRIDTTEFNVGVVWAGRPMHTNDRNRSCRLEHFLPLSEFTGIRLVGLQKGSAAAQAAALPADRKVVNFGEEFEDFSDTAGLIDNLDLVITVDTAVAHLAGAMAKPVWVLLPFIPDWRWMMHRQDSPWYPTMRLFRQKKHGDWKSVFQQVAAELQNHALSKI
jgi:tetratricopeptide (TPR) repeat protein